MKLDFKGRIRNTVVPRHSPLIPIYEAIANSYRSHEKSYTSNKYINVEIVRDNQESLIDDFSTIPIKDVIITDNGIGFNNINFEAFCTSDTTINKDKGGRGIGRFSWLVVFDHVIIRSTYLDEESLTSREFIFSQEGDGINDHHVNITNNDKIQTAVILVDLSEEYKTTCPKKIDTIASYIIDEFAEFFISFSDVTLNLIDSDGSKINLTQLFENEIISKSEKSKVQIGKHAFTILHLKIKSKHKKEHMVYYCGSSRVVEKNRLYGKINNLPLKIEIENGESMYYSAYVESDYLNETMSPDRTHFAIQKTGDISDEMPSWEMIEENVYANINDTLSKHLTIYKQEKSNKIERIINTIAPRLKPLAINCSNEIDEMSPDLTDEQTIQELEKIRYKYQRNVSSKMRELLESEKFIENSPEYDELMVYFKKYVELNGSDLAEYVLHRRVVLEMFMKRLNVNYNMRHERESDIHNVIFPMGFTSEEIGEVGVNLWLLDERLSYHHYLASDKSLKSIPLQDIDSTKEPDILIYDNPHAFSNEGEIEISAVYIIEIKRPMREEYTNVENPIDQVLGYASKIRSGKFRSHKDRIINIGNGTPIYGYILCDLTDKIRDIIKQKDFDPTPDGLGYVYYHRQLNMIVEIVSYDKLIKDAIRRNNYFFEKIGLEKMKL